MASNKSLLFLKTKTPHFFKVILAHQIDHLEIPKVFLTENGGDLQNDYVILKVLPNTEWKISLTKSDDGTVLLCNEWKQFAEYYSLDHGHFLTFEYLGNSRFSVIIFGQSASEIDYPYYSIHGEEYGLMVTESERQESKGTPSGEILDDIKPCRKRRQDKSSSPRHPRPRKLARTNLTNGNQRSPEFRQLTPKQNWKSGEGTCISKRIRSTIQSMQQLSADEKAFCLETANGFVSNHPFFLVFMTASSVCGTRRPIVNVPSTFSRKYFKYEKDSVILHSDGRTWPASYYSKKSHSTATLYHGWMEFAEDNHLQVGDTCAFELIDCDKLQLRVTVFRLRENEPDKSRIARINRENCYLRNDTPCTMILRSAVLHPPFNAKQIKMEAKPNIRNRAKGGEGTCSVSRRMQMNIQRMKQLSADEKAFCLQTVSRLVSNHPFFVVSLPVSSVCGSTRPTLNVPSTFPRKYFKNKKDSVILHSDGRTWPASYYSKISCSTAILYHGWMKFAEDNHLQIGDVCAFELIDCNKLQLRVTIFRVRENDGVICAELKNKSRVTQTNRGSSCDRTNDAPRPMLSKSAVLIPPSNAKEIKLESKENIHDRGKSKQLRGLPPLKAASTFTSEYPMHRFVIKPWYEERCKVPLPREFIEKLVKERSGNAEIPLTMLVGEKNWPMKLCKQGKLNCGWTEFSRENSLQTGDSCVLELIDEYHGRIKKMLCRELSWPFALGTFMITLVDK
ncbi:hypothetical protein ACFE04_024436 [Oxalis oulophora]